MNFTKWAKTRETETREKYQKYLKSIENQPNINIFTDWRNKKVIAEFEHWAIIENDFPYDAIASTNHLLFTKREIPFDWDLLNQEELKELNKIRKEYLNKNYEVVWENLPKGQTVPVHFHLHLLTLIRE